MSTALLATCTFLALAASRGPTDDVNPYQKLDGTWITISGQAENIMADRFTLDYGDGSVIVEMDDGDRDADAYKLVKGDKVTVNGRIDNDFYELTTIEASSVYVEKLGTYFYASSVDDEDVFFYTVTTPIVIGETIVRGTVTEVDSEEFVIDTGERSLRVEVENMPYDPLDDRGYQKIEVDDYVGVAGQMDADLFEVRELVADTIVELAD